MISILLTVLKIIGIMILVILGLILFILLLVLFAPVRYNGRGSYQEGSFVAKLHASWLLHIVSMMGELQREQQTIHFYIKIFGITIYDNLKADGKKTKHKKTKSTQNKTKSTGEIQAASSDESISGETAAKDDFNETDQVITDDSGRSTVGKIRKKSGIAQKVKTNFIKFVNFLKNIKFTFNKVCDTILKIKNNIKYYLEVLQLESTKRALAVCRKQLKYVLGKILPRKYTVNLHLGFDDPAVMGEVLAVWGMLYPLHTGKICIQPEFEQSVMEGDFSFRGHVSVVVFVRILCILFFDKDIRRLIKHLKRSEG